MPFASLEAFKLAGSATESVFSYAMYVQALQTLELEDAHARTLKPYAVSACKPETRWLVAESASTSELHWERLGSLCWILNETSGTASSHWRSMVVRLLPVTSKFEGWPVKTLRLTQSLLRKPGLPWALVCTRASTKLVPAGALKETPSLNPRSPSLFDSMRLHEACLSDRYCQLV